MKLNQFSAILTVIIFATMGSIMSCGQLERPGHSSEPVVNQEVTPNAALALDVEGMVCSKGCVMAIQSTLAKKKGVAKCVVDYDTKVATIEYDNKLVSETDLIGVFPTIGSGVYTVTKRVEDEKLPG